MDPKIKAVIALLIVAILAAGAYYLMKQVDTPRYSKKVAGVQVDSMISFDDAAKKTALALFDMPGTTAETTCNFELSQVSTLDPKGYQVSIVRKPIGITLDWKGATISGETDDEILQACHAYVCMRDGIDCTSNLMEIKNLTLRNNDLILVIDNSTGPKAMNGGFVELAGALGFIQAHLIDADKNGIVEPEEVNSSKIHIFPYIMQGDLCILQKFQDALQITNITNDTTQCNFRSGIYLQRSKKNSIQIDGRRVIISGDDEHIYTGSVIVRDIISPEYVRFLHRLY